MQQNTAKNSTDIIEQIKYVANEYIHPVFTGMLAFAIIMFAVIRLTGEGSPLYGMFLLYAYSADTIATACADMLIALLAMAALIKLQALATAMGQNKKAHKKPDAHGSPG